MKMQHRSSAFTLVEVMVAAGIVVVLMVVLLGMTDQTQRLVKATSSKVEQFQEARAAFEAMTRRLSQATLNSFWDYTYSPSTGVPNGYARHAELRFVSGSMTSIVGPNHPEWPGHGVFFQAPLGMVESTGVTAQQKHSPDLGAMDHLMNSWGYFVEVGIDPNQYNQYPAFLSTAVTPRKRYRLMELMEPSEKMSVYKNQSDTNKRLWYSQSIDPAKFTPTKPRPVRVLAENVVALILLPRLSLADERTINQNPTTPPVLAAKYLYDSTQTGTYNERKSDDLTNNNPLLNTKNQLPPVVQVIMVAIDEPSARRLEDLYGTDTYLGIGTNPDPKTGKSLFTDPASLNDNINGTAGDLTRFQNLLSSSQTPNIRASYRVFSSNVTIKGAKWSLHTAPTTF